MTRNRILAAIAAVAILVAAVIAVFVMSGTDDPVAHTLSAPVLASVSAAPTVAPEPAPVATGIPSRLRIPALKVDAQVVGVGTGPDNSQEVPPSLRLAGWWRDGVQPGAPGNAVMVGHTASAGGGVFDALIDAKRGDVVTVEGKDGRVAFRVTRIEELAVRDFDTVADEVYRSTGRPGLVLMTCGDWNGKLFETTVIVHAAAAL